MKFRREQAALAVYDEQRPMHRAVKAPREFVPAPERSPLQLFSRTLRAAADDEPESETTEPSEEPKSKKGNGWAAAGAVAARAVYGVYRGLRAGMIALGAAAYYTVVAVSHTMPALPKMAFGALIGNFAASLYYGVPVVIAVGVTSPVSVAILIATAIGAGVGFLWHLNAARNKDF
jgi:hypothetical protein